ncbi:toll/interleukin-1 receptor domain-containing protein [Actinokineospora sp. NBRC 105648]|uniref:tetratricopeptide repeat protein n=1 Tax=Actinokineospora sp. NBRC 105648 TaxID=3032206 RepID=UPI0024A46343|nr:toll/interleukin-1 receptor domain-containing protein [Actinokineospora sp. NBRC 105648]GLZ39092.1 hypothetical protein Acsp05_27160 [Actinokineospora sp. NBRC 105648]
MTQVFLSHAPAGEPAVELVERALVARGITVFRDRGDGSSDRSRRALADSVVLLAFYSRDFPVRHANQWALTRAILAARAHGDPRERVLVVNPEAEDDHLVPAGFTIHGPQADLVDVVATKVAATKGIPFGGPIDGLFNRRRFSGRYRECWSIHNGLNSGRAVVLRAGSGLAEQYVSLFGDAYPGGVEWIGLAGMPPAGYFAAAVSRIARERFGLDFADMATEQAIGTLADKFIESGQDTLWVIDDVPEGLDPEVLEQLVPRSPAVRAVLTTRSPSPGWDIPVVDCAVPLGESAVADRVAAVSAPARVVLAFAAVLARAPIAGELLVAGVSQVLGGAAPVLVAKALAELDELDLLHRVDRSPGGRQAWKLPEPVATAVRRTVDAELLATLADRAASIISAVLTDPLDLHHHALRVATQVAETLGMSLLREVALRHERGGDLAAAHDIWSSAPRGATSVEDLLTASRVAIALGDNDTALAHAFEVITRACGEREPRTEFRARFLAAVAYDERADYAAADAVFHDHAAADSPLPVWLDPDERLRVGLARVRSLRLRGDYRAAIAALEGVLPEVRKVAPIPACTGLWPVATLELARLRLLTGAVVESTKDAASVARVFAAAGLRRHRLAREAVAVRAEALLARSADRDQAASLLRRATADSSRWYGPDDPLTLELRVLSGQALRQASRPADALVVLAEARRRISAAVGAEHPLALRAGQTIGLATTDLADWTAAAGVFDELLPRQCAVLGRGHPDSQLTRFHLGVCLIRLDQPERAEPLIHEARAVLAEQTPWRLPNPPPDPPSTEPAGPLVAVGEHG